MQRVTVSLDLRIAPLFDAMLKEQGYQTRSEAVRDLVREAVETHHRNSTTEGECVANLAYVYSHSTRLLAQRLLDIKHQHHDLIVSSTQIILEHTSLFETVILKGPTLAVRALADLIRAERGVRFGSVNVVAVEPNGDHHTEGAHHHASKSHLSPLHG